MILRVAISLFLMLAVVLGSDAVACSCAPPQSVESSVRKASSVVVAEVVSSEQRRSAADAVTEDVTFRVIETFKGTLKPGSLLRTHSNLGPAGPCGVSVKNSPVWLESGVKDKPMPASLAGRWILYVPEKQPFELSMCGPSVPMEAGGGGVLRQLRVLAKRDHPSK